MTSERIFHFARNMAEMSDFKRFKLGSVVMYKGKIIGMGFNSSKTHPLQKKYNKIRFSEDTPHCLHAEMSALIPLKDTDVEWEKVKLYVYRIKGDSFGMARPCKSCMAYIKKLGIKNIYYTSDEEFRHEVLDV